MTNFRKLYGDIKDTPEYLAEGIKLEVALMIEAQMERKGISKTELAQLMGHSKPYISNALKGDTNFSILSLSKLAHALDCELKIQISQMTKNKTNVVDFIAEMAKKQCNRIEVIKDATIPSANSRTRHYSIHPSEELSENESLLAVS